MGDIEHLVVERQGQRTHRGFFGLREASVTSSRDISGSSSAISNRKSPNNSGINKIVYFSQVSEFQDWYSVAWT